MHLGYISEQGKKENHCLLGNLNEASIPRILKFFTNHSFLFFSLTMVSLVPSIISFKYLQQAFYTGVLSSCLQLHPTVEARVNCQNPNLTKWLLNLNPFNSFQVPRGYHLISFKPHLLPQPLLLAWSARAALPVPSFWTSSSSAQGPCSLPHSRALVLVILCAWSPPPCFLLFLLFWMFILQVLLKCRFLRGAFSE